MSDELVTWIPTTLLLLGALAAWGLSSLLEGNASIFVATIVLLPAGLALARLTGRDARVAIAVFTLAYALRTAAALFAFYSGKGETYWIGGSGSDAIAYYQTSFLDLGEALFEFTYRGFVTYNNFVTHSALRFDDAHYLCNLQGPVVAGALLPVLVFAVIRELRDVRTATVAALILACHPALISISAVLLRDSLVGVFGWAMMYLVIRLFQSRTPLAAVGGLALTLVSAYVLSLLRLQSMLVFAGLSLVMLYFATKSTATRRGLPPALRRAAIVIAVVIAVAGTASLLAGRLPPGLDAAYFQSVVEYRLDNASQGSLGVALSSSNVAVSAAVYSLIALLAPLPFYAWSAEALGHPTGPLDYLTGLGGLVNQLILGLSILGFARAVRRRDALSLTSGVCIIAFVALTTLGGGDTVRYIAVHVFPLYLMFVVDGGRIVRAEPRMLALWSGAILALYTVYESLKSGIGQPYAMLSVGAFALYLVTYLVRAWRLAGTADPRPIDGRHVPVASEAGRPLAPI